MKSVLISIQPKWVEKIANKEKTIEVRKTAPKEVPFKAYIYCTKEKPFIQKIRFGDIAISHTQISNNLYNGKVIGEFICDKVIHMQAYRDECGLAHLTNIDIYTLQKTGLKYFELFDYITNGAAPTNMRDNGCLWHISDLKIYDKPKELSEFYYCCKEMKANEPRAGKYVSLSCYACRHNALKRTEDYSEYNNMLGYICKRNITRPPQSWCYVEELQNEN